jgi:hypothetical protein
MCYGIMLVEIWICGLCGAFGGFYSRRIRILFWNVPMGGFRFESSMLLWGKFSCSLHGWSWWVLGFAFMPFVFLVFVKKKKEEMSWPLMMMVPNGSYVEL